MAALQRFWRVGSPLTINVFPPFLLSAQLIATIRLKPAVKDREGRANPPVPTLLAPLVRAPTGETMPLHPTNLPSGAPWSPPLLPAPLRRPPHAPAALGTPRAPPSWTLVRDGRCCPSPPETARSLDTSPPSGEPGEQKQAV